MQVMLMRLMSKGEYLIVPKGTKFKGSGKLGLTYKLSEMEWPIICFLCQINKYLVTVYQNEASICASTDL